MAGRTGNKVGRLEADSVSMLRYIQMRVIRMMDCGITQRERGRTGKEYSSGQYVAPEHPGSRALRMLDRYELEAGVSWGRSGITNWIC
jgi:hypothetical protein